MGKSIANEMPDEIFVTFDHASPYNKTIRFFQTVEKLAQSVTDGHVHYNWYSKAPAKTARYVRVDDEENEKLDNLIASSTPPRITSYRVSAADKIVRKTYKDKLIADILSILGRAK